MAGLFRRNPFLSQRERAEKCALQHNSDNRIEGVGRKFFSARDKISRSVVYERVHTAEFLFSSLQRLFHGVEIADIRRSVSCARAFCSNGFGSFLQRLLPARDEENICAQFSEA